ncbi:MAG TPA: alpha/beta fold hydrolase [Casimicrobiaceae bacterium]
MAAFIRILFIVALMAMPSMADARSVQDWLMFYPTRVGSAEVREAIDHARDQYGAELREWHVGGQHWGLVAEPMSRAPSRGTALLFHGNAGWAGDRLYYLPPLLARGYRVVLVEYPGYGPHAGESSVEGVLGLADRAVTEALHAWPGQLLLVGESLGAGVVAQLGTQHEATLKGLVLVTPWDSLRTLARMHYPWLPTSLFLKHPMDSIAALRSFRKPIAVLVAGRDEIVGAAGGLALAKALGVARLVQLPNAGHNDWLDAMTSSHWDELLSAFDG